MLKQLLSKIKEQRSTTSSISEVKKSGGRSELAGDTVSVLSGDSRAEWTKPTDTTTPDVSRVAGGAAVDQVSQPVTRGPPSDRSADSVAIDNNQKLIDELRNRIEMIE